MARKKNIRPAPIADDEIDIMQYISLAAPGEGMTDDEFEAHLARQQRRCSDCGGEIEYERDGHVCATCAEREMAHAQHDH